MSWKELLVILTDGVEFGPPAAEEGLAEVERSRGVPLPLALGELHSEVDGLKGNYDSGLVWSAADIEERNREFRSDANFRGLYMPFDHLLFFGSDAGGDQFAFAIQADGQVHQRSIYRWDHESDSRSWYAARLEQYLERRLEKN